MESPINQVKISIFQRIELIFSKLRTFTSQNLDLHFPKLGPSFTKYEWEISNKSNHIKLRSKNSKNKFVKWFLTHHNSKFQKHFFTTFQKYIYIYFYSLYNFSLIRKMNRINSANHVSNLKRWLQLLCHMLNISQTVDRLGYLVVPDSKFGW